MNNDNTAIYAVLDTKAQDLVGGIITIHKHPASAVRMFSDALSASQGDMARHPEDYVLVRLGFLTENNEIITEGNTEILTGSAWKASMDAAVNAADAERTIKTATRT